MEAARDRLSKIESLSDNYCKDGQQKKLIKDLNTLSNRIKKSIKNWKPPYLIHNDNVKTKDDLYQMIEGGIE